MDLKYTASLSKGRLKWCVIFPHPLISDDKTGKPGMRVRRGLGTEDRTEAQEIVDHVNAMLGNKDFWQLGARDVAAKLFKAKAVAAFYDHDRLRTAIVDPWAKREEVLKLPTEGYSIVQIVGPFGVGKTTLIRQLIGTDPETERFPSTSKGRATICDTEIICAPGQFSAVVSFLSHDRVLAYVEECVEAAVSAAAEGHDDKQIARCLLEHTEQRFRLAYALGKIMDPQSNRDDVDEEEETPAADNSQDSSNSVSDTER